MKPIRRVVAGMVLGLAMPFAAVTILLSALSIGIDQEPWRQLCAAHDRAERWWERRRQ